MEESFLQRIERKEKKDDLIRRARTATSDSLDLAIPPRETLNRFKGKAQGLPSWNVPASSNSTSENEKQVETFENEENKKLGEKGKKWSSSSKNIVGDINRGKAKGLPSWNKKKFEEDDEINDQGEDKKSSSLKSSKGKDVKEEKGKPQGLPSWNLPSQPTRKENNNNNNNNNNVKKKKGSLKNKFKLQRLKDELDLVDVKKE